MTKFALDPFKKGNKTEVEGVRKIEVEKDLELMSIVEQYQSLEEGVKENDAILSIAKLDSIVVPAEKIYLFTEYVISGNLYKSSETNDQDITGMYITRLIQNLYDINNNHNKFILNTGDSKISKLGRTLKSNGLNKIELIVNGDIGNNFCRESYLVNATVNGDAGSYFGVSAWYSYLTVNGKVGFNSGYFATNCFFRTNNSETYYGWKMFMEKGNFIELIDENGEKLQGDKI